MAADPTDYVTDLVHEETQVDGDAVHLTLANVLRVEEPGRVDFGGGELDPARFAPEPTSKRNPDDDYAWWTLGAGTYLLEHNESLTDLDSRMGVLQTRPELLERGAYHPTLEVSELRPIPLTVGGAGLKLKENARVSVLQVR